MAVVVAATLGFAWLSTRDGAEPAGYEERACALDQEIVERIARGHDPIRSNDVTMVPKEPNFVGSFTLTSHSGPWDYVQNVPLVLYGPGYISPAGRVDAGVDLTGVYPTMADLFDLDLPPVDGRVLPNALDPRRPSSPPKLALVVVWDGAGRSTLERWPNAWPTLKAMEEEGVSYVNATVGSSPSVTSATHSTLGTGNYPSRHGITANDLRLDDGRVVEAFEDLAATKLRSETFADEIDKRFDNESKVGLLAWVKWHVGMLGHGEGSPGGDGDEMALVRYVDEVVVRGNEDLFEVPEHITGAANIETLIDDLDREDGVLDGKWLENDIRLPEGTAPWNTYSNPAWARYQAKLTFRMLKSGSYGQDEVPDVLLTNFKMTDLAGHMWGIEAEETREVLREQDKALADILRYLDREVGDYIVVVTADHGASQLPTETGAWPIDQKELIDDLEGRFGVSGKQDLIAESSASGLHLDREVAAQAEVSAHDVADFLNAYTIADNSTGESLPEGYEDRGEELVMSAAFPASETNNLVAGCGGAQRAEE